MLTMETNQHFNKQNFLQASKLNMRLKNIDTPFSDTTGGNLDIQ